ncbi:alpha/beta fold hydrolase [Paenibacillus odorifer]|uniref:alpha/beta fold hydrolase n=1 Tax=Paenibacillus odorifer TaxID=189426 RepID=UPI0020BE4D78|nr:alpha/beta hydrolase [Paenibacillus odorifer]
MKLHFKESGNRNAETVVFIHACAVGSWSWYAQLDAFKDYHCITVDLPEHGGDHNDRKFTIAGAAEEVAEIIRLHANGGKACLIGHEVGAKIALEVMKRNEKLVSRAVISSVVLRNGAEAKMHKVLPRSVIVGVFLLKKLALKTKGFQRISARAYGVMEPDYAEVFVEEAKNHSADWLVRIIQEGYLTPVDLNGLEKNQTPTLILVGEKEPEQIRGSADDLYQLLPNRVKTEIRDGLHSHPRLQRDQFNQAVLDWLHSVDSDKLRII